MIKLMRNNMIFIIHKHESLNFPFKTKTLLLWTEPHRKGFDVKTYLSARAFIFYSCNKHSSEKFDGKATQPHNPQSGAVMFRLQVITDLDFHPHACIHGFNLEYLGLTLLKVHKCQV